jgi:hypothetical protein
MNFVAHGWLSAGVSDDPGVIFASMLPDLRHLVTETDTGLSEETLSEGKRLHNVVDAIFHHDPQFVSLVVRLSEQFRTVGRSAQAVAHVAVELSIDGWYLIRPDSNFAECLRIVSEELTAPWQVLVAELLAGNPTDSYLKARSVAARSRLIVAQRPALARGLAGEDQICAALEGVQREIQELAAHSAAHYRDALSSR